MTNHKGEVCLKCQPEKQPWEERFDEAFGRFALGENNGMGKGWRSISMLKPFISQLLKEEQCCLCKDKGVIELIEEAVEAERQKTRDWSEVSYKRGYQDGRDSIFSKNGLIELRDVDYSKPTTEFSDALQVINKEGDKS